MLAAPAAAAAPDVVAVFIALAAALAAAKILGELAERLGQPAVLGELVAGVVLGPSILDLVDPHVPAIHVLAEIGVVILLFQIGLETDLKRMLGVGGTALTVACVGVALPFLLGDVVSRSLGLARLPALVTGAALTATSVGITARVFSDLGRLHDSESQVVLGAAVIDDVIGLIILGVVGGLVGGAALTTGHVLVTSAVAVLFLVAAVFVGRIAIPPLFDVIERVGRAATIGPMALAFMFVTAVLAKVAGLAPIVGAFTAGLVLAPTRHAETCGDGVTRLGHFFVPIFFVVVGAAVDVHSFASGRVLAVGGLVTAAAIAGKLVAGYAAFWFPGRKLVVGVGMIPRGEVGLIFAQMGRTAGVLDAGLYAALMLMVLVTTFVTPPALKLLLGPGRPRGDAGGSAELVTEA
jgi:Kef-type K+ transport system membrane component KefB